MPEGPLKFLRHQGLDVRLKKTLDILGEISRKGLKQGSTVTLGPQRRHRLGKRRRHEAPGNTNAYRAAQCSTELR